MPLWKGRRIGLLFRNNCYIKYSLYLLNTQQLNNGNFNDTPPPQYRAPPVHPLSSSSKKVQVARKTQNIMWVKNLREKASFQHLQKRKKRKERVLLAGSRSLEPGWRCRLPPLPPSSYTWRLVRERGSGSFLWYLYLCWSVRISFGHITNKQTHI